MTGSSSVGRIQSTWDISHALAVSTPGSPARRTVCCGSSCSLSCPPLPGGAALDAGPRRRGRRGSPARTTAKPSQRDNIFMHIIKSLGWVFGPLLLADRPSR